MAVKGKTIDRKKRKKKNTKGSLILIVLLFVLGIGVLLYPTISDLWNTHRSNRLVTVYQSKVDHIPETRIREELRKARGYNRQHGGRNNPCEHLYSSESAFPFGIFKKRGI